MNCTTGTKGKLKSSGREFEIVKTTSTTSTIRFRWENQEHTVEDKVLHEEAEMINEWSEKHVETSKGR